ncbi:helix-turn-helix domain-containing protein [Pectinatus frisingensis]|uniref:helix-turn-helix domain-containing protein n=1 Tax=Pectinatus frisingensis TaxID=865 RepID=UPI0018C47D51|nr:helix-turn-helix transcriptional regulator [Pectinatus frisingensis]
MNIIKQLRQENKLTQENLGKKLNIQKSAISKYETGRSRPSLEALQKLSSIFNVSIDTLLEGLGMKITTYANDSEHMQPKDLKKFLDQTEIMFDGEIYNLTPEEKEMVMQSLKVAFYAAKRANKRKKDALKK